jgi:hypothetical protein
MVLEIFTGSLVAVAALQSAGPELSSQFREQKRASELREVKRCQSNRMDRANGNLGKSAALSGAATEAAGDDC